MMLLLLLPVAVLTVAGDGSNVMETELNPVADPAAVVLAGKARFTVLTPAMIRLEWSPTAAFEDRASLVFLNRRLPLPQFTVDRTGDRLTLMTEVLTLRYLDDGQPFSADNLAVERNRGQVPSPGQASDPAAEKVPDPFFVWKPGLEDRGNLGGTYRTLDSVSGSVALPPGLLSRDGWVVVDDSRRLLFERIEGTDWPWATPRAESAALDWYFFGYGHDYKRTLADFTRVAGRIPLPPRFAFGAWWSRYWAYSDEELKELVAEFREHDVPLDVLVIDMDWHLDGWTGYTWNPRYFPDPEGFLKWVHEQGLRATLNLHPASGVKKQEQAFPEVARAMGLDPETADQVPFDCTDPRYVDAYFKCLHHPLERQGVDFWWIDWQQGGETKIKGLDPLWWLNYLHWTDLERNPERGGRRPMMFSRWGGLGNHRYQIGFSGDTYCNWPSLAFQPHFTATAGNVCYPYWSHDIGGHAPGPVEPELYARWIQWGVFSPILRTHTTKNPEAERRIWKFPAEVFQAAREAFQLRYALLPYTYTAARQCYDTGLPLCRPLYYEWPELEEAYRYRGEYLFGDDLLVAPVTKPTSPISGCAQARVWLPPGEWTYWFSGRTFTGPGLIALQLPLDEIPLFVRGGAIIPMQPKMNRTGEKPVDPLILHIWPGDSGSARVYEDDGETTGYQRNECTWTPVAHKLIEGVRHITIGPAEGQFPGMLERRRYEVRLRDLQPPGKITVNGLEALREFTVSGTVIIGKEPPDAPWWSDEEQDTIIHLPAQPPDQKVEAIIEYAVPAPLQEFPQGLRGRFRIMSELLNRAATKSPEIHQKFMRRFEEAVRERDSNKGVDVALVETVNEATDVALVDTLLEAELDPVTMRRALARLLNACAELEVSARAENNINLAIHVSAASIDGAKVASEVTLHATPHWRTVGEQRWAITELKSYEPVTVTTPLRAEQWPQTAVIGGNIVFRTDKLTLDVPLEQVVLPSVNRWWIIGPFDAESKEGLEKVFPPEETIDLAATYEGKAGRKIGWQKVERRITPSTDLIEEFFVKLSDVFGRYETNAVCYALTYLHAPEDTDAVLAFGTDDGVVVWLNGTEVYRLQVGRPYRSKEDRLPIRLSQGSNALLLKVSQSGGDWGFCVHVETPDGQPLTAVTAHLTP